MSNICCSQLIIEPFVAATLFFLLLAWVASVCTLVYSDTDIADYMSLASSVGGFFCWASILLIRGCGKEIYPTFLKFLELLSIAFSICETVAFISLLLESSDTFDSEEYVYYKDERIVFAACAAFILWPLAAFCAYKAAASGRCPSVEATKEPEGDIERPELPLPEVLREWDEPPAVVPSTAAVPPIRSSVTRTRHTDHTNSTKTSRCPSVEATKEPEEDIERPELPLPEVLQEWDELPAVPSSAAVPPIRSSVARTRNNTDHTKSTKTSKSSNKKVFPNNEAPPLVTAVVVEPSGRPAHRNSTPTNSTKHKSNNRARSGFASSATEVVIFPDADCLSVNPTAPFEEIIQW